MTETTMLELSIPHFISFFSSQVGKYVQKLPMTYISLLPRNFLLFLSHFITEQNLWYLVAPYLMIIVVAIENGLVSKL